MCGWSICLVPVTLVILYIQRISHPGPVHHPRRIIEILVSYMFVTQAVEGMLFYFLHYKLLTNCHSEINKVLRRSLVRHSWKVDITGEAEPRLEEELKRLRRLHGCIYNLIKHFCRSISFQVLFGFFISLLFFVLFLFILVANETLNSSMVDDPTTKITFTTFVVSGFPELYVILSLAERITTEVSFFLLFSGLS